MAACREMIEKQYKEDIKVCPENAVPLIDS
jgi:hypothetical protein